jgi:hypothetical protein
MLWYFVFLILRQTGSRNLMGPKTLPTIWGTYMKLVTKYQISAINSCWEKCDEKCAYMFNIEHICSFFIAFFSATIDGRNLIFGHKLHIGTPYRGKRVLTRQIPTSCLPIAWTNLNINLDTYKTLRNKQDELWANAHLWYPRSSANRK